MQDLLDGGSLACRQSDLKMGEISVYNKVMEAQLINYLKLSKLPIGYLMNFNGLKLEWKRFVFQKDP